jgi:hypothetical protein
MNNYDHNNYDLQNTGADAERTRIVGLFDEIDSTYWGLSKLSRYQRIIEGLR